MKIITTTISVKDIIATLREKYGISENKIEYNFKMVEDPGGDTRDDNRYPVLTGITFTENK